MSKRCQLGKSCGATCIERRKLCLEGMRPQIASAVGSLRNRLHGKLESESSPVKPAQETPKPVAAPNPPPQKPKKGVRLEDIASWKDDGGTVPVSSPAKVKLGKLETTADFEARLNKGLEKKSPELEAMHSRLGKLLGNEITNGQSKFSSPDEEAKFNELRKSLFESLKDSQSDGKGNAKLAYDYMQKFMRSDYGEIRNAQLGIGKSSPEMDRAIRAIERLMASSSVERPEVEKFRGMAVSPQALAGMIASSRSNGSFRDGAIASWSTNPAVAQMFSNTSTSMRNGKDQMVILRTVNRQGVPVNSIAPNKIEDEVLTPGGAKYKYSGYRAIQAEGNTYHIFDLEES